MGGEVAALTGAFTWALTTVMVKEPVGKMGALAVNNLRTWVGAFVFLALLVGTGRVGTLLATPLPTVLTLALAIIIGLGIGDTLYFHSVKLIGVSRALPISGCYPLPTFALSALWLGERVTLPYVAGTGLIIVAVYLTSIPDKRAKDSPMMNGTKKMSQVDFRRGVAYAVICGLFWALSSVLLKFAVGQTDLIVANAIRLPAAGLVLLVAALRQPGGLRIRGTGLKTVGPVVLSGITGTALGSFLYLTAVVLAGAGRTAALNSVAPFFGAPLALIFLKERIAPPVIAGTLLSVAGVWLLLVG